MDAWVEICGNSDNCDDYNVSARKVKDPAGRSGSKFKIVTA